jgi:hypothetical protein
LKRLEKEDVVLKAFWNINAYFVGAFLVL